MKHMRKRGFIVLIASLPVWAVDVYLWWGYGEVARQWDVVSPPDFLVGTNWAAIATTLVALGLLLVDFISYLRNRNDREHPTN